MHDLLSLWLIPVKMTGIALELTKGLLAIVCAYFKWMAHKLELILKLGTLKIVLKSEHFFSWLEHAIKMTHLLCRVLIVVIKVLLSLLLFFLLLKRLAYETGNLALSPWLLSSNQESRDLV